MQGAPVVPRGSLQGARVVLFYTILQQKQLQEQLLTHLPYADWCPICVACRRPNVAHGKTNEDERTIPLLSVDYCFLQDSQDEETLTTAVARIRPSRLCRAIAIEAKGGDKLGIRQLASFIKEAGLTKFVCFRLARLGSR